MPNKESEYNQIKNGILNKFAQAASPEEPSGVGYYWSNFNYIEIK